MRRIALRTSLAGILLALALPGVAHAATVTKRTVDDDLQEFALKSMVTSFRFHAMPLAQWYLRTDDALSATAFESFERRLQQATYAMFIYSYGSGEQVRERTYYAMSGSRTPLNGMPHGEALAMQPYVHAWPGEVLATVHEEAGSAMAWGTPVFLSGAADLLHDAELKAIRSIEDDIRTGIVPGGGRVTAIVSRSMCRACEVAVGQFAGDLGIDVVVTTPHDGSSSLRRGFEERVHQFLATVKSSLRGTMPELCHVAPRGMAWHALPGDGMSALLREELSGELNVALTHTSDTDYAAWVLTRPLDAYSSLRAVSLPPPNRVTRLALASLSSAERHVSVAELHEMNLWDLGFTRAVPGTDVPGLAPNDSPSVRANAAKAGIDDDIYRAGWALTHGQALTVSANYAVAAQLLRETLDGTHRSHDARDNLRPDVLDRFLLVGEARDLSDFDAFYLTQLLDGEMARWSPGRITAYGLRTLPPVLRVARLLGAYVPEAMQPCTDQHRFDAAMPDARRFPEEPLCFADATDRAVHAWYARLYEHEVLDLGYPVNAPVQRLIRPLWATRQGVIGDRVGVAQMLAAPRLESVEARSLAGLYAAGLVPYVQAASAFRRAARLMCEGL